MMRPWPRQTSLVAGAALCAALVCASVPARAQTAATDDTAASSGWQTEEQARNNRKRKVLQAPIQLVPKQTVVAATTPAPTSDNGGQHELVWQPLPPKPTQEKAGQTTPPKADPVPVKINTPASKEESSTSQLFCKNIADAASDARYLNQKAEIERLEQALTQKIALLEEKKAEYQKWLERRDSFIQKTEDNIVALYTKVKPDVAASQMSAMDEETAAAVLAKLSTRSASSILNQMSADKAARLVSILVGVTRKSDGEEQNAEQTPPADNTKTTPPTTPPAEGSTTPPPPPPPSPNEKQ